MSRLQFYLTVEGSDKTNVTLLKRVRNRDSETWYSFTEEFQKLSVHSSLMQIPVMKSAQNVLKNRGQYRCVNVTLPDELLQEYCDADDNFIFKNYLLPETRFTSTASSDSDSRFDQLVSSLSKVTEPKEESVKEILKHFLIEKFSAKNRNVLAWCELFEKESRRFSLSGRKQIEVLKSCLESSLNDWFAVNQRRFPETATWKEWREKLISTFGDNSWSPIRYAFNFKYYSGSYIDYAVRKEKMLLELDRDISDLMILDLIVVGLPMHVQNSLNRFSVKNIELLHQKLKKYESEDRVFDNVNKNKFSGATSTSASASSKPRQFFNNNVKSNDINKNKINVNNDKNFVIKKPCPTCISKGHPNRFHPESACWYLTNQENKVTDNKIKVNNVELESSDSADSLTDPNLSKN